MKRPLTLAAALVLLASGCHMCSDCCDYSSPVANGPYAGMSGRAGSISSGQLDITPQPDPLAAPVPPAVSTAWSPPSERPITEPVAQFVP